MNHSSRDHAKFGPSSLVNFDQCRGFISSATSSVAAERGTSLHEALHLHFTDDQFKAFFELSADQEAFEFGCRKTQEIIEECRGYSFDFERTLQSPLGIDFYGTPDFWAYDDITSHLIIRDYKSGFGSYKDPFSNLQLLSQAILIIEDIGFEPNQIDLGWILLDQKIEISSCIGMNEIQSAIIKIQQIAKEVEEVEESDFKICSACKYCSRNCSLRDKKSISLQESKNLLIDSLSNDELASKMIMLEELIPIAEALKNKLSEAIASRIEAGAKIQGFELIEKQGKSSWKSSFIDLKSFGIEAMTMKPKTITEVKKDLSEKLGKKEADKIISELTERKTSIALERTKND